MPPWLNVVAVVSADLHKSRHLWETGSVGPEDRLFRRLESDANASSAEIALSLGGDSD